MFLLKTLFQRIKNAFQSLLGNKGSLSQRAIRGGVWVFFSFGAGRIFALLSSIVLARLLAPAEFGIAGMAAVATGLVAVFTEIGIFQAVIYKQDDSAEFLNTAWWLSLLRGLGMFLITFLTAGWVASFFNTPQLKPVLMAMSLIYVLNGMNSIGLILLQRELEFKKLSALNILAAAAGLAAAISAALVFKNVWAIVFSSLAQAVVTLIGSYIIHNFRPGFHFSRSGSAFFVWIWQIPVRRQHCQLPVDPRGRCSGWKSAWYY